MVGFEGMLKRCGAAAVALTVVASGTPAWSEDAPVPSAVRAIFEERCTGCHGAEKQKAKLRLDTPEGIQAGAGGDAVFVAGKPEESSLYGRTILPADHEDIMPPKGDPLTTEQTDTIKAWIVAGASFEGWDAAPPAMEEAPAGDAGFDPFAGGAPAPAPESTFVAPPALFADGALEKLAEGVEAVADAAVAPLRDAGALVMPLAQNTPLVRVDAQFAGGDAKETVLPHLAGVANQLTWLNLARRDLTGADLAVLAQLPKLTSLHLEGNPIGDDALDHVAGLSHLEYLNLYGTQVTDAGIAKLKNLRKLKRLYVWQTQVTPAGVAEIEGAIPGIVVNTGAELAEPEPAAEEAPAEEKPEEAA